jgi:hypothetical protein
MCPITNLDEGIVGCVSVLFWKGCRYEQTESL